MDEKGCVLNKVGWVKVDICLDGAEPGHQILGQRGRRPNS